jgi:hypothetical protein
VPQVSYGNSTAVASQRQPASQPAAASSQAWVRARVRSTVQLYKVQQFRCYRSEPRRLLGEYGVWRNRGRPIAAGSRHRRLWLASSSSRLIADRVTGFVRLCATPNPHLIRADTHPSASHPSRLGVVKISPTHHPSFNTLAIIYYDTRGVPRAYMIPKSHTWNSFTSECEWPNPGYSYINLGEIEIG